MQQRTVMAQALRHPYAGESGAEQTEQLTILDVAELLKLRWHAVRDAEEAVPGVGRRRKRRWNALSADFARELWHSEEVSQVDTNGKMRERRFKPSGERVECLTRTLRLPVDEAVDVLHASKARTDEIQRHGLKPNAYSRGFIRKHMCPCCGMPKMRSCVCETCETVNLLLAAITGGRRKYRKQNDGFWVWEENTVHPEKTCHCEHCKKKRGGVAAHAAKRAELVALRPAGTLAKDDPLLQLVGRIKSLALLMEKNKDDLRDPATGVERVMDEDTEEGSDSGED